MRLQKPRRINSDGPWDAPKYHMVKWAAQELGVFRAGDVRRLVRREFPGVRWARGQLANYVCRMAAEGCTKRVGRGLYEWRWTGALTIEDLL